MNISKWIWAFVAVILAVNLMVYVTGAGGEQNLVIAGDIFPVICSLFAVIGLYTAFSSFESYDLAKVSWMLLLLGTLLFFLAESTYFVEEVVMKYNMDEYFPSIADAIWFAGYIPLILGLYVLIYGYVTSGLPLGNLKLFLIPIGIAFILMAGGLCHFLLLPIMNDQETSGLAKFSYLFYPTGDLFLILPSLILAYITSLFAGGLFSKPWKFIVIGFIVMTGADILYSYLSWNDNYQTGNIIDIAWNSSYLLLAIGGFYQSMVVRSA
jgi:hypothetical protein